MPKIDANAFALLGQMIKPPEPPSAVKNKEWHPRLTNTQEELFYADEKYILCHAEKGSGKTYAVLHKLVKHCYLNENAMALIVVTVRSMANKGGAWSKLQEMVLPCWRDGNRDRDGKLLDEGMGLHFTDVMYDSQHNELIWIQNQYGGWSCVILVSAPHATQLRLRIRGYEPSFVFVDELTSCDSPIYFTSIAAQLGRRLYIEGPQQYIAATNPDDPEHWVYKKFFVEPFDEETGDWDKNYRHIYFPISENLGNLNEGYHEGLRNVFKNDPIEALRMIGGEWVARPSGDALFGDLFKPEVHMRPLAEDGKPDTRQRLVMVPGYPIIVGIDPGGANNAFIFMQFLPVGGKWKFVIFDEIVTIRKKVDYRDLIPVVMRRVKWLRELAGGDHTNMQQVWISDNSAFNQFRAAAGSYDVLDFERIYEANRVKIGLEPLGKIKACPKFNGSDLAQTQLTQRQLASDEILLSSSCPRMHRMFLQLDSKKQKEGEVFDPTAALTPRRSDHLHCYKAFAYVTLFASLSPTALVPTPAGTQSLIRVA